MIPIQNVYYMLSYAFQVLSEQGYKDIATEQFDNTAELCAAILTKGIASLLKRGLGKEYIPKVETLSTLRGKIEVADSIKGRTVLKKQLVCSYDDFSVNSYMNRILKTTAELLLHADISKTRKKELRKLMAYFCIFRLHPATCTVFFCHLAEQNPPPCRGCLPLHRWCKGSARSLRSGKALASKVQLVNQSS